MSGETGGTPSSAATPSWNLCDSGSCERPFMGQPRAYLTASSHRPMPTATLAVRAGPDWSDPIHRHFHKIPYLLVFTGTFQTARGW